MEDRSGSANTAGNSGAISSDLLNKTFPSRWTIVIVTLLFGFFGIIPTIIYSNQARREGFSAERYWRAFWYSMVASILIWIAIVFAFSSALGNVHPYSGLDAPTTFGAASVPSTSPATPSTPTTGNDSNLTLPTESESDSPVDVVGYMDGPDGIYVRMYQSDNTGYLLHYYPSISDTGYAKVLAQLNEGVTIHHLTLSNLGIASMSPGLFEAEFNLKVDNFPTHQNTTTYKWDPTNG
jgi:hypothetical protein